MKRFYAYILIIFMSVSAFAETYRFAEMMGGKPKEDFVWDIKKTDFGISLYSSRADRQITYHINSDGSTRFLKTVMPFENTDYTGEISGSKIVLKGKLKGKQVNITHEIDGMWMQSITYSMNLIYKTGKQSFDFYSIRPDNLDLVKMKAANDGLETLTVDGKKVEAYRVKVTLTGFLSGMWSSTFWYRKSDLIFVRYDGKQGLTESSRSVINMKN